MSKPTIKDLQAELYSLKARHAVVQGANDRLLNEVKRLKGSPKVQEQLNMANGKVAELMGQVKDLQTNSFNLYTEKETLNSELGVVRGILGEKLEENEKLKSNYTLLQYNYSYLDKMQNDLIDKYNKVSAENHALKLEIERTNRHINLAEN